MTVFQHTIFGLTEAAMFRMLELTHRTNAMDFEAFFEEKLGGLHLSLIHI